MPVILTTRHEIDTMLEKPIESCIDRRQFIGGSDARVIIGQDEKALIRLWKEKRGEVGPEGPLRQPHRPARPGDRGPQSPVVRTQHRKRHHGCPVPGQAPGHPARHVLYE
jgi:hypothetical protein